MTTGMTHDEQIAFAEKTANRHAARAERQRKAYFETRDKGEWAQFRDYETRAKQWRAHADRLRAGATNA